MTEALGGLLKTHHDAAVPHFQTHLGPMVARALRWADASRRLGAIDRTSPPHTPHTPHAARLGGAPPVS